MAAMRKREKFSGPEAGFPNDFNESGGLFGLIWPYRAYFDLFRGSAVSLLSRAVLRQGKDVG
jgi:hypothetical protein